MGQRLKKVRTWSNSRQFGGRKYHLHHVYSSRFKAQNAALRMKQRFPGILVRVVRRKTKAAEVSFMGDRRILTHGRYAVYER